MSGDVVRVSIGSIVIGDRHRQDFGDLRGLADSIDRLGLLQPIGITADRELVFGHRRLLACELLGLDTIESRIVDVPSIVEAEHDENECRKQFTTSERVAIADAVSRQIGDRSGRPSRKAAESDHEENVGNCPHLSVGRKTRDIAAEKAGFSSTDEYRRARTVVEQGTSELVSAMDTGQVSVSRAAAIATKPKADQAAILADLGKPKKPRVKIHDPRELYEGRDHYKTVWDQIDRVSQILTGLSNPDEPADPFSWLFEPDAPDKGNAVGFLLAVFESFEQLAREARKHVATN